MGLAVFTKNAKKNSAEEVGEKTPRKWDTAVNGELTLDKILHVSGNDSWGPVTNGDQCVRITIV